MIISFITGKKLPKSSWGEFGRGGGNFLANTFFLDIMVISFKFIGLLLFTFQHISKQISQQLLFKKKCFAC